MRTFLSHQCNSRIASFPSLNACKSWSHNVLVIDCSLSVLNIEKTLVVTVKQRVMAEAAIGGNSNTIDDQLTTVFSLYLSSLPEEK